MTVGKSGEVKLNCGGVPNLTVTVQWEERVDASAHSSQIAVTGMTVTAGKAGRYTMSGTVSMEGAVLGRLTDCVGEVTEIGVPGEITGAGLPVVSAAVSHKERESVAVLVQLTGEAPDKAVFYATGRISTALTVQPRISQVGASSPLMGRPMMIVVVPADSGAVHSLRYEFLGTSGVIGSELTGGAHSWIPPMELCTLMPDREREACTVYCDTYIGGVLAGTSSCTADLIVPYEVGLELTEGWVTLVPHNEGTAAEGMDCCVQGFSRVRAVFDESRLDSSGAYGACPVSFEMTVGEVQYDEPYVSRVLHDKGIISVTCGVVDSRGRRCEEVMELTVLPYTPPALGDVIAFRCDADGTANERGDCLSVSVGWGICALGGRNRRAVSVKLRTMGGQWSESVVLSDAAPTVLWAGEISPNDSYELLAEVVDALGKSASVTITLPCTNVFFHGRSGGRGAAFGKRAEEDDVLEVAWSLKTKGDLVAEGSATIGGKALWEHIYPVGAVCTCQASADPAVLFGGTWVQTDETPCHWVRTA